MLQERIIHMSTLLTVVYQIIDAAGERVFFERGEGYHLKLYQVGYMPLVIEAWGTGASRRVSVAHYYEQNGDLIADPDILMDRDGQPLEMQQPLGYTRVSSEAIRRDILSFMRLWASNIQAQGWIEVAANRKEQPHT
jgi:hypothetical protein